MGVPEPPQPFEPHTEILRAGSLLYRVYSNTRTATDFNPGMGPGARFSFFGDPPVPVLYAAQTERAALCETLLHDVPLTGGILQYRDYAHAVAGRLEITRDLLLASFLGTGLRALGVEARRLTDTPADTYPRTVAWAQAAYEAGFDGVAWMSRRCNSDRAYVLFVPGQVGNAGAGGAAGGGSSASALGVWHFRASLRGHRVSAMRGPGDRRRTRCRFACTAEPASGRSPPIVWTA